MSWLKVDDGFPSHEKVMALSEGPCRSDAIALWVFCGCWTSHALRDGFVPNGVVRAYGFHLEAAPELVRVGLWLVAEGGYRYHDWADYQPSSAQVEERRRAGAERKARSRAKLSTARVEVHVGESHRDGGIVTAVPRIESRPGLADASRVREREDSESSSSEAWRVGYDWFCTTFLGGDVTQAPNVLKWREDYSELGRKSETERSTVAKVASVDPWVIANRGGNANPGHFVKHWGRYATGGPKTVSSPASSREQAEAGKQAAIASQTARLKKEFADRIKAAREADDDYTANRLAAERDMRVAKLQAQAS